MRRLEEKINYMNRLKEAINSSKALFFLTFKGISVQEVIEFKKDLKRRDGEAKVVKNTLLRRVLLDMGMETNDDVFQNTTMVVFCKGDPLEMAKSLISHLKDKENLKIKGGIYDFKFINPKMMEELSTLPGKNELIGQLIGLLRSPLTRLIYIIGSPYTSVINTIYTIKKKKEEN